MGSIVFIGMLLVIGAFFLAIALDYQGWNTGMASYRAERRWDKSRRPEDAFDEHHAINTASGWMGAILALLFAVVIAIESLAGFHPGH
jgi:hypothetical protein